MDCVIQKIDYKILFKGLQELSNDGFWVWFIKEDYEYLSPRFKQILGYNDDEMENHPSSWEKMVFPEDLKKMTAAIHKHFENQDIPMNEEIRYTHKKGNIVYVICRGSVISRDIDGSPLIVAGTHTDITKLKEYQQKIEKEKDKLSVANENKTNYIARLNHEIRTPLHVMMSYTQLLQMSDMIDVMDKEYVNSIYKTGGFMLEMVNDVIDIAKLDSGAELPMEYEWINVDKIIDEMIEFQKINAQEVNVVINKINKNISDNVVIFVDKKRFCQILINLLNNGIKYNKIGYGFVKVKVELYDDDLLIHVEDGGIGITEMNKKLLFKPFVTLDDINNSNSNKKILKMDSSGIGLALVKLICDKMGFDISVESTLDIGSTFTIKIPKRKMRFV